MSQRHMLKQFGILGNQRVITFMCCFKLAAIKTFGKGNQHIQQDFLDNLINRDISLCQLFDRCKRQYSYSGWSQSLKAHIARFVIHHTFHSGTQRLWSKEIMGNVFFILEIKNTSKTIFYKIDMPEIAPWFKNNIPLLILLCFRNRIKEDFEFFTNLIFLF